MPTGQNHDRPRPSCDAVTQFGERLRAERKRQGLTQKQLATKIESTDQSVRGWETGRHAISEPMIVKVAEALSMTVEELWPDWDPALANWGGRRDERLPAPARLDRLEAELAALKAELAAGGYIRAEAAPDASELNQHLERLADVADQRADERDERSPADRLRQKP